MILELFTVYQLHCAWKQKDSDYQNKQKSENSIFYMLPWVSGIVLIFTN